MIQKQLQNCSTQKNTRLWKPNKISILHNLQSDGISYSEHKRTCRYFIQNKVPIMRSVSGYVTGNSSMVRGLLLL